MANKNEDKKFHFLYKTINVLNNKYYYGMHSTNKIEDGYLGSGKHLRYSISKYGKDNFKREIIKQFDNREDLVKAEEKILTKEILEDKQCMNIMFGGEKFNTLGMTTVIDKDGNGFKVFVDDPRFLSGELFHPTKDMTTVIDKDGNIFNVSINDPRYLSGELVGMTKGLAVLQDKDGNTHSTKIDDPRYLSGELFGICKNMTTVKDKDGKYFSVSLDDPRYLSGELVGTWTGLKHTDETKKKMSEKGKLRIGNKNSQFGTCWITKEGLNKKIKKEELESYINEGWIRGRKMK